MTATLAVFTPAFRGRDPVKLLHCLSHFQGSPRLHSTHAGGQEIVFTWCPDSAKPGARRYYTLTDNGGEWNLWEINSPRDSMRSIPYTHCDYRPHDLDYGTQAYRIMQALAGDPIDYDYLESDEITGLLLTMAAP